MIFNLPIKINDETKNNNNLIITNDIFKKMVLISCRIKLNIPVIIMGEQDLVKQTLILKLNKLLNNGKGNLQQINIGQNISNEEIYKIIKEKEEIAQKKKDDELWLYFANKTGNNFYLYLPVIKEIFFHRTYNGKKISDNIRIIGTCYPNKKTKIKNPKSGLNLTIKNENETLYSSMNLPQQFLYCIFNIHTISEDYERKYIYNVLEK